MGCFTPGKGISERLGIQPEDVRRRSKDATIGDARKILCCIGSRVLEIPQLEIGRYLGVSTPAVWRLVKFGKEVMEKWGMNDVC